MSLRHGGLSTNPSASNCEAFVNCGASHVLPQYQETAARATSGTDGHDKLTAIINRRPFSGSMAKVEKFPMADFLRGVGMVKSETAYAVNVKTRQSRYIGTDISRNYGVLADYEIPVSLDVDGMKDGTPWVRDFKFGLHSSVWQLYVQSMARAYDPNMGFVTEVDAGFTFIDGDSGGETWWSEEMVLGLEILDTFADVLVEAFDRVPKLYAQLGPSMPTHEGAWCKYCHAAPHCPSKWSLVKSSVPALEEIWASMGALTTKQCGSAWAKLKEIQRLADRVELTLKERLGHIDPDTGKLIEEPFPLPNGKVLHMIRKKGWDYPQKEKTLALLKRLGATEEQIKDVMVKRADALQTMEKKT